MDINTGISSHDRDAIANGLAKVLADSYTLYLKAHNSADLLTRRMQIHEKNAWMLRSMISN